MINQTISTQLNNKRDQEQRIKRMNEVGKRFVVKAGGDNIFAGIVDANVRQMTATLQAMDEVVALNRRAMALLDQYTYLFEDHQSPVGFMQFLSVSS